MANQDDNVQHGIDDNPNDDAKKGLELGALGGGTVGAIAGSVLGPVGTVVGALVGGSIGSIASGAAVQVVDAVDNDNTVSGVGDGSTTDAHDTLYGNATGVATHTTDNTGGDLRFEGDTPTMNTNDITPGNNVPGIQTGGTTTAGADTRGISEKIGDFLTGDNRDDKTGGMVTGTTSAYYGNYEGRDITRDEYDALNENDRLRVRLLQEELHVDKAERQIGEVEISKRVVEEQVQVPVTLEREEVIIHRRSVADGETLATGEITDETIVVPVREEFAQVTKTAHVAEEIEVERRVVAEQKTVSDTVRHEELNVTGNPQDRVRIEGDTSTNR